jgi:hypothetical protein
MISNRQCSKLKIDVSYTKQTADDFLIANFGTLIAEWGGPNGLAAARWDLAASAEIRKQPKWRGMNDITFSNR